MRRTLTGTLIAQCHDGKGPPSRPRHRNVDNPFGSASLNASFASQKDLHHDCDTGTSIVSTARRANFDKAPVRVMPGISHVSFAFHSVTNGSRRQSSSRVHFSIDSIGRLAPRSRIWAFKKLLAKSSSMDLTTAVQHKLNVCWPIRQPESPGTRRVQQMPKFGKLIGHVCDFTLSGSQCSSSFPPLDIFWYESGLFKPLLLTSTYSFLVFWLLTAAEPLRRVSSANETDISSLQL